MAMAGLWVKGVLALVWNAAVTLEAIQPMAEGPTFGDLGSGQQ